MQPKRPPTGKNRRPSGCNSTQRRTNGRPLPSSSRQKRKQKRARRRIGIDDWALRKGQRYGPPPRYIGIYDWALRKGQRYGTIIIDLERDRVLDLLPGRDGEALKTWLKEHPG